MCMLSDEIFDYQYVCQGKVDADTVDDGEDMKYLHVSKTIVVTLSAIIYVLCCHSRSSMLSSNGSIYIVFHD